MKYPYLSRYEQEKAARARATAAIADESEPRAIVDGEVWTQEGATIVDMNGLPVARLSSVCDAEEIMRALIAVDKIHKILDGTEWDSDALGEIADAIIESGRTIRDLDDC